MGSHSLLLKLRSPILQADPLPSESSGKPRKSLGKVFCLFVFCPHGAAGMWDLSSPTRDGIQAPYIRSAQS